MTKRATFTQAELARASKAADAVGKIAIWTAAGIAFVDPAHIGQPVTTKSDEDKNTCHGKFGVDRSR